MDERYTLNDVVRTELVDELYKKDHDFTVSIVSKHNTEEEKEQLKDAAYTLEQDIEDIRIIQEDLLNWILKDQNCKCVLKRIL